MARLLPKFSNMGRRAFVALSMTLRLTKGTAERVDKLLEPTETRSDFIREAIEQEIQRRERQEKRRRGET